MYVIVPRIFGYKIGPPDCNASNQQLYNIQYLLYDIQYPWVPFHLSLVLHHILLLHSANANTTRKSTQDQSSCTTEWKLNTRPGRCLAATSTCPAVSTWQSTTPPMTLSSREVALNDEHQLSWILLFSCLLATLSAVDVLRGLVNSLPRVCSGHIVSTVMLAFRYVAFTLHAFILFLRFSHTACLLELSHRKPPVKSQFALLENISLQSQF